MSDTITSAAVPAADAQADGASLGAYAGRYIARVRGGEMGALPALIGLVGLVIFFSAVRPRFLTALNFANLFQQGAAVAVIAMGLIFVLLLGVIDLSAGFTSGVCAAVMAKVLGEFHWPWYAAILAAIVTGTIIGTVIGWLVVKVGIPSFVVTLAAFLAFQGVLLVLIKGGTIVSITDPTVLAIGNKFLSPELGWALAGVCVVGYAATQFFRNQTRARRGVTSAPMSLVALRIAVVTVVTVAAVYVFNLERSFNPARISVRGVPIVIPIIVALLVVLTFILKRTRYGLHLYAVGGNLEAARRAGINTDRVRIAAFMFCSTLAAVGGVVAGSRAASVDPNTGGSKVLLFAVGAAVIGGASLFGGKGRILDAVLGGVLVAVIQNGLPLITEKSSIQYIVTGLVLLGAAGVDALSRKRAAARGAG
jgi:D-xylose transport system permease protein